MADLSAFVPYVAVSAPGAPSFSVEDAVRRAVIQFCTVSEIYDDAFTLPVVAGERSAVAVFPAGYTLARVIRLDGADGRRLHPTDKAVALASPLYTQATVPTRYWVDGTKTITFSCLPLADEAMTGRAVLKPSRTASVCPDAVEEEHLDAIVHGAKAILLAEPNRAWSNAELALFHQGAFEKAMNDARVGVIVSKTGGELVVKQRQFGVNR